MTITKPRNRVVYFRISEEEFHEVARICKDSGARSISDLARMAMRRVLQDSAEISAPSTTDKMRTLDESISELNQRILQLTRLMEKRSDSTDVSAESE